MILWKSLIGLTAIALTCGLETDATAQSARISGLEDVDFGTLVTLSDQSRSQSVAVCSYKNNPQRLPYAVTALGSGTNGAFSLASGPGTLNYEVQWSDSPAQTNGIALQPGVPRSGQNNAATGFTCSQQADTASLTLTIRATELATAYAGSYSGSLQVTVAPQ